MAFRIGRADANEYCQIRMNGLGRMRLTPGCPAAPLVTPAQAGPQKGV